MKKLLIILFGFLLLGTNVWAGVEVTVLGKELDKDKSVIIFLEYKIDGVVHPSDYPNDLASLNRRGFPAYLQSKEYYVLRYRARNFVGLNNSEKRQYIINDINAFSKELIRREFVKKSPETKRTLENTENQKIIDNMNAFVGNKYSINSHFIQVDTDFDGVDNQQWEIFSDGTVIKSNFVP